MPQHPAETSLIFLSFSFVILYGPALAAVFLGYLFLSRRRSRLERKLQRQQRVREEIAARGRERRRRMALRAQRRNTRELAALVHTRLDARRRDMSPSMHQRASAFVEKAVTDVDFDRLHALYTLLGANEGGGVSPAMESFFEHAR